MKWNTADYVSYVLARPQDFECGTNRYPGYDVLEVVTEIEWRNVYLNNGQSQSIEVPITKLLLGKKENGLLVKLQEDVEAKRVENNTLRQDVDKSKREVEKLNMDKASLDYKIKSLGEQNTLEIAKNEPLRQTIRKMEGDIAKIKSAIGELQFNKILGVSNGN